MRDKILNFFAAIIYAFFYLAVFVVWGAAAIVDAWRGKIK